MNQQHKPTIEGYTDQLSVEAGEEIGFHVSTNTHEYAIEIARVGVERKIVWTKQGLPGAEHPVQENSFSDGCNWPVALKVAVPENWKSGYYEVTLTGSDRAGSRAKGEMSFVIRSAHPGRDTKILLQRGTNTDNAYNTWGGADLYRGTNGQARRVSFDRPFAGSAGYQGRFLFSIGAAVEDILARGEITPALRREFSERGMLLTNFAGITTNSGHAGPGVDPAERVPYQWHIQDAETCVRIEKQAGALNVYDGFTTFQSGWRNWEHPFVEWVERAGYEIDYAVNSDLEFHPEILDHYKLVLSVGHDEYWSSPMRDHLEAFIARGGNVAFFSGNSVYWQVRSEDNGRALVGWKQGYKDDPHYQSGDHRQLTTLWCSRLVGRPENQLTGVSFAYGGYHRFFGQFQDGVGAYTVHRPDHWVFEGAGLKRGDLLGARDKIVSYECDGCDYELEDGLPVPTHRDGTPDNFEILAGGPAALSAADDSLGMIVEALHGDRAAPHRQPGAAMIGIYTRGGTVVTVGSTNWSDGLHGGDKAVERITRNILDRLSR